MRRLVALLLVAGVAAASTTACGGKPAAEPKSSGVYGTVKRGPLKPICTRGASCYGPAPNVTLTFSSGGKTAQKPVARPTTDAKGDYRIALAPGTYVVQAKIGIGGVRPTVVRVTAGKYARLDLVADTGIR